ncbi:MAG: helix-turn-helix domain-containing protein [Bacteroides sp.]|nr:helix-turn-helix domain-containing protein [Prevotella sp.]MCM1407001.1 helix-turn-helix domain-containing protein [Treponema brennaborense]MCM1470152.1 helix-turn-helix domain-containing protein [Bacteroides sp.]
MKGIGQDFDEFMREQGLYDEAKEIASKRIVVLQLEEEMKRQHISKAAMAKQLNTSRAAVDNVLNISYNSSLETLERFAKALGKKVQISLV